MTSGSESNSEPQQASPPGPGGNGLAVEARCPRRCCGFAGTRDSNANRSTWGLFGEGTEEAEEGASTAQGPGGGGKFRRRQEAARRRAGTRRARDGHLSRGDRAAGWGCGGGRSQAPLVRSPGPLPRDSRRNRAASPRRRAEPPPPPPDTCGQNLPAHLPGCSEGSHACPDRPAASWATAARPRPFGRRPERGRRSPPRPRAARARARAEQQQSQRSATPPEPAPRALEASLMRGKD